MDFTDSDDDILASGLVSVSSIANKKRKLKLFSLKNKIKYGNNFTICAFGL